MAESEVTEAIPIGERIESIKDLIALPVGAVIGSSERDQYVKTNLQHNYWRRYVNDTEVGGEFGGNNFSMGGYNTVYGMVERVDKSTMTLTQFIWNFWDGAWKAQEYNGVGSRPVEKTMQRLGIKPGETFGWSAGMQVRSAKAFSLLPTGTLLSTGNPQTWHTYGLFVINSGGSPRWVTGEQSSLRRAVVDSVPGQGSVPLNWVTAHGTEEDAQAIRDFKARAWRFGWDAKVEAGWCSVYEEQMSGLGVTESDARELRYGGFGVGSMLRLSEQRQMPEGTVLLSRFNDGWALYRRDNTSDNRAMTRRVLALREQAASTHHQSNHATVAYLPIEPEQSLRLPLSQIGDLTHVEVMNACSAGSAVETGGGTYVKAEDGRWTSNRIRSTPATGDHYPDAFRPDQTCLTRVGG